MRVPGMKFTVVTEWIVSSTVPTTIHSTVLMFMVIITDPLMAAEPGQLLRRAFPVVTGFVPGTRIRLRLQRFMQEEDLLCIEPQIAVRHGRHLAHLQVREVFSNL